MATYTDWRAFLEAEGAQLSADGAVAHFGAPDHELQAAADRGAVVPLTHLGVVSASGRDAKPFLQAQLTSDLEEIGPERAGFSGYCSPKGRLIAIPLLLLADQAYLLVVPRAMAPSLASRLRRFVLRAQVNIEDASDRLAMIGTIASQAIEANGIPGHGIRPEFQVVRSGEDLSVSLPGSRVLWLCRPEQAPARWRRLADDAVPAGRGAWDLAAVRAGLAEIVPATQEAFLPQMLGLEQVGAVSFTKGCYPGQEIVARARYLGDLKRRLYRARSAARAAPGDPVFAATGGDAVGQIAAVAPSPDGGFELLAVLLREQAGNRLRIGGEVKGDLTLEAPPAPAAAGAN